MPQTSCVVDDSKNVESKDVVLERLNSLVEKCRNRFVNRYELATDNDPLIVDLCSTIEYILNHGFKCKKSKKHKLLSGIIPIKNGFSVWNFLCLYLSEHEVERFAKLRDVQTDHGRVRSWIRNSLNEHSLEKYLLMILEDDSDRRQQFYHEWALLYGPNTQLPSLCRSLNSILFALNIDSPDLDETDDLSDDEREKLAPIKITDQQQHVLIESENKKCNIVVIDKEIPDLDMDDSYAKSAPVRSFMVPEPKSTDSVESPITNNLSFQQSSSSFSVNDNSNLYLYPIDDQTKRMTKDTTPEETATDSKEIEQKNQNLMTEKFDQFQRENDRLSRENDLLNIQLKRYKTIIDLLKQKQDSVETDESDRIKNYERKLMQVSEMHGELVEFSEHLYKVIQIKDSIISRLRNELIELRGPLPDNDEILSISTENTEPISHPLQSLPQPLIHVWIPTAFLSGGFKGKSHHIYQIYVRIKEEEWNVYRRYSQFHSLHKLLKNQYPGTGRYEFPPKKAIGNKDSKVVQERRKKLESYLRNVINHIQLQHNNDISNKENFISILPFLSDKYFLQDRSHSDPNLSDTQQQQPQQSSSRNYLGF